MNEENNSNFQTGGVVYGGSFDPLAVDCCSYGSAATEPSFSMSDLLAMTMACEHSAEHSDYKLSNYNAWAAPIVGSMSVEALNESMKKVYEILTAPPVPFKRQIVENPEVENEFKSLIFEQGKNDDDADQSI